MRHKELGLGLISDKEGRHGRIICLSIEKLGIIHNIQVIKNEIIYPKGTTVSNKLRLRIKKYLGV